VPASLDAIAAPVGVRGQQLGGDGNRLVEQVERLVLDVNPLVISVGRR
jgi:hypothetical protein